MIALYCRGSYHPARGTLCPACRALDDCARLRADRCPHMETKTVYSNCKPPCYKPALRAQMRTVMRYAGPRMLLVHPVLAIRHLLESNREKRAL